MEANHRLRRTPAQSETAHCAAGSGSSRQLVRLGDHPLDCLKRPGTINAVRRIFDFLSAEDSEYAPASDDQLEIGYIGPRHHRSAAMPSEIRCGDVPSRLPHAVDDRPLDGLHSFQEIAFRLHATHQRLPCVRWRAATHVTRGHLAPQCLWEGGADQDDAVRCAFKGKSYRRGLHKFATLIKRVIAMPSAIATSE